jgi:glyoxylase-like metal-dependent hydrolase (beta-lactamase superfamily II)
MLNRRCWLAWAAALLAGCSSLPSTVRAIAPATPIAPITPIALAPGVYLLPGAPGAADAHNLGRIGNAGFIVGEHGVITIDTGTSLVHGRALLAAIRTVTHRPLLLALVTHTRPEFLFGGAAFREQGVPIVMHEQTARLMAARCDTCLKTLRQTVGEAPMAGTTLYTPERQFSAGHLLDATGRAVRVLHFGHSSGPGDIAVFDVQSGVLFGGGLLDAGRVPDIQDSDLPGWQRALAALRALPIRVVVPGHGPASPPTAIEATERYLLQLDARVRDLVASGVSLLHVAEACELPEFAGWDQYDSIHRRNASVAYLRVERELLFKPEAPR